MEKIINCVGVYQDDKRFTSSNCELPSRVPCEVCVKHLSCEVYWMDFALRAARRRKQTKKREILDEKARLLWLNIRARNVDKDK